MPAVVKHLNVISNNENMTHLRGLMSLNFTASKLETDTHYLMAKHCIKLLNINHMPEFIVHLKTGNTAEDVVLD